MFGTAPIAKALYKLEHSNQPCTGLDGGSCLCNVIEFDSFVVFVCE